MSIIRIIILAVVAYFGYKYYSWPGAVGVVGAYVVLVVLLTIVNNMLYARRMRQNAAQLVNRKLSDSEKTYMAQHHDHQQRMEDHKAQFDPELRKSRGQ